LIRALLVMAIFAWLAAQTLSRPYVGTYLWTWISMMNPHKLTWGVLNTVPMAQLVAGIMVLGLIFGKQKKLNIWSPQTVVLLILILWVCLTTIFAFNPTGAIKELDRFLKIQIFIFLILALISDKQKLDGFIWVMVLSIGFFSVKGGIFTILTGGNHRVWGPEGSFIAGNNELGLAMLMTIPLMRYLQLQSENKWIKIGLVVAMLLTAAAILGTHSRGALVGIVAIGIFFWVKSPYKMGSTIMVGVVAMMVLMFMPQSWWDRMNTIQTYEEDSSAQTRIISWQTAINVANDNILGGGANMFTLATYQKYSPDPSYVNDAHSIYFEMLGEQGWIGLFLFLLLAIMTWRTSSKLNKTYRNVPDKKWVADLAAMVQVSLIGYYTAGAFLGLAYYDYYYNLVAVSIILSKLALEPANAIDKPDLTASKPLAQHKRRFSGPVNPNRL
jgi:probable O-glycosylation ligase (exosortase A-associated)